jgi:hypothetical protein
MLTIKKKEDDKMTVFIVETYAVKPGKQGEFMTLLKRIAEYKKENPEKFKEMRSKKVFSQMFGGISGGYIEMNEFDSMADVEKYMMKIQKDEGFIKLYQEALLLTIPTTYSLNVWKAVM